MPFHPVDGLPYHPDANLNCQVCNGYGVVDEGDMLAMLVNCKCVAEARKDET